MDSEPSTHSPTPPNHQHTELALLQARVAELERALADEQTHRADLEDALVTGNYGLIILDRTLAIRHWNQAAEAMYGWAASEVVGQLLHTVFQQRYPDGSTRDVALAALAQQGTWSGDLIVRHRAGHEIVIMATARYLHDAAGEVIGAIYISRDITERYEAERALRASEGRYRTLIEHLPVVIFQADVADIKRTSYVSPQIEALLDYTADQWLADPTLWISRLHPDDRERVLSQQHALLNGQRAVSEHRMLARDGRVVWVRDEMIVVADDPGQPPYVLGVTRDITQQRQAEEALHLRNQALAAVSAGIVIADAQQPDLPVLDVNPAFTRITGYTLAEVYGRNCRLLQGPETDLATCAEIRASLEQERECQVLIKNYRKDGMPFWNELTITPVRDALGQLTHFVGVLLDVTERLRLEAQIRQSQKIESVGRLAGGVAHDFNNILTVISGATALARESLPAEHLAQADLQAVAAAAERATALTRQLLAFARRQRLTPRTLNLNTLVQDTEQLLRRLLNEDIQLQTDLAPDLAAVKADPNQIQQVLLNLALNARDAMPAGGKLTIATANVIVEPALARVSAGAAGPHVRVTVTDTGTGMPPEVQARLFEPFFTTKEPGHGTGLGLATSYGIVQQHGGSIWIDSTAGAGTTVTVYLPSAAAVADEPPPVAPAAAPLPRGTETILVVEDEPAVRMFAVRVLRDLGYTLLEAGNGVEALGVAREHTFDLLLTDVVMPTMGGVALVAELAAQGIAPPTLYMSGYSEQGEMSGAAAARHALLQKPFTRDALAHAVRDALDAARLPAAI
jgi:PAS domain S-box-containing protein